MQCVVYMGSEDVRRQAQNVFRMKLLGAELVPVESGSKTLKDALNEAMRDWVTHVEDTFYIIGTVAGPHPYPMMVRDFQTVIGRECLAQMPEMIGRQPDAVIACVGGGSNAIGIFHPYIPYDKVRLVGVEAAGDGIATGRHAASLTAGRPGVLHGNRTYLLQDANGQIVETHSVSAGLDYPGVGPEHAWLKDSGRAEYVTVTDDEALAAFHDCCRIEGIIPALESCHALAHAARLAVTLPRDKVLLVNLSGRGDKDMNTVAERAGTALPLPARMRSVADAEREPSASKPRRSNRIDASFRDSFARLGRTALIPYVTAGDPSPAATPSLLHALVGAGADVLELGVPFSDPMADGPVVQRASERALAQGVGLADVLAMVAAFRQRDATTPVVLMGYANPIEAMGEGSVRRAGERGRRRRRHRRRLSARGGARVRGAARRARARADLPAVADDADRAHGCWSRAWRAATSTTSRSRASPAPAISTPPRSPRGSRRSAGTSAFRSASASAFATPRARRRSPRTPMPWSSAAASSRRSKRGPADEAPARAGGVVGYNTRGRRQGRQASGLTGPGETV